MARPFHWDFEARNVAFKLRVCGSPAGNLLGYVGHVQCFKMLLVALAIECVRPTEASKRAPVAYRLHRVNVSDPQKHVCSLLVRAGKTLDVERGAVFKAPPQPSNPELALSLGLKTFSKY